MRNYYRLRSFIQSLGTGHQQYNVPFLFPAHSRPRRSTGHEEGKYPDSAARRTATAHGRKHVSQVGQVPSSASFPLVGRLPDDPARASDWVQPLWMRRGSNANTGPGIRSLSEPVQSTLCRYEIGPPAAGRGDAEPAPVPESPEEVARPRWIRELEGPAHIENPPSPLENSTASAQGIDTVARCRSQQNLLWSTRGDRKRPSH